MSYRALLATTSFEQVAGSEILLLELAEALQQNGFACELTAHDLNQPMRRLAAKAGVTFVPKPSAARPLSYDLVWLQTQIGATMDFSPGPDVRPRTFMAFAHLDLRWDLAAEGFGTKVTPALAANRRIGWFRSCAVNSQAKPFC
jgi:hypothetical protein